VSARIVLEDVGQTFLVRGDDDRQLREFTALDGLDLTIEAGEFLTLVGPSGCGKSTVLDLVAGLTAPSSGRLTIGGEPITGPGLDRSVVFQQYTLLPWRTAQANIEFALEAKGGLTRSARAEVARRYLDLVGLGDFAGRYPHELSGGMKQRVAIARSLSYEPEVLLMDEPFGALDAQTRERLQEELVQIWRRTGTTVVFITHDIEEAVFLGQRVAVMSGRPGRIKKIVETRLEHGDREGFDVRGTPAFAAHRHEIWSLLREQQHAAPADVPAAQEEVHRVA
jgi:NitT/TauT family transport system ATP-binding protein